MYASNEDEFNGEEKDWVFLPSTTTTIVHGSMNLLDNNDERSNSSSSSRSSSSSCSSKTTRSDSLSSSELEPEQNEELVAEPENSLSMEDSRLAGDESNDNHISLSTFEVKDDTCSSEIPIQHVNENESSPVINEYDLSIMELNSSLELLSTSNQLRQRIGAHIEQSDCSIPKKLSSKSNFKRQRSRKRADVFILYALVIVVFVTPVILIRIVSFYQPMPEELKETNERLDGVKNGSISEIEQKLTKQFEEKFQTIINQKLIEFNQEKVPLLLQINELYQLLNLTQENLSNTIDQLADENKRFKKQIISLEHRLQINEQRHVNEKETKRCPKGVDCTKSSTSPLNILLTDVIKETVSIADDTSLNRSSLFERLNGSLSDRRHEYVEQSNSKLFDLAGSATLQPALHHSGENLSSSLRHAKSNYAIWARSRAENRERARMQTNEHQQKTSRRPWRWTFQRGYDREQMRHKPPITNKQQINKEYVCDSKYDFPVNQLCSMKQWMERHFRP